MALALFPGKMKGKDFSVSWALCLELMLLVGTCRPLSSGLLQFAVVAPSLW